MATEERAVEGYSSSGGQYTGGNAGSAYPRSIGPGAEFRAERSQGSPSSLLQQVQEIRSHYSFDVRDRTLFLGYDLHGAARRYSLPFAHMPLSGASVWLLYGGPIRTSVTSTFVIDTVRGAENLAHRPLTQAEAEGYALHASRRTMYSIASPISALWVASILAIHGRKTMKFPFRKPQPLERYDNFPNRWLPVLKGNYARIAWQITRFNVYTILCLALIAPVYASMGDSAMMVGLYKDPRTHEVTKSMAASLKNTNGRLQRHTSNRPGVAQRNPQASDDTADDGGFYTSSEQGAADNYSNQTDYSDGTAYTDGTVDTSLLGDSQMQSREARQPSPSSFTRDPALRQKPVRQGNQTFRNKPAAQSDRDFDNSPDPDYFFDDASPTAGNDPDTNAGTGSRGGSSGSAWERIRRSQNEKLDRSGAMSQSRQSSQGSRRGQTAWSGVRDEYETSADSFSFSTSERDRQLAKEQAQKDFDRMLEEERKGVEDGGAAGAWGRRR